MTEPQVRQPIALRTVHNVEMAAVGTWHASTGWTTFTDDDMSLAVGALDCPGIRNPVIKLGHAEEDSTSGLRWDGEPALGWVANMRFDGAKLIGDFTGMPDWLTAADENGMSVLASAYPDRSIEIYRPFVCQIGHLHESVVTAVALLGVAPPGVGVLKSMQDVYAAYTVPEPTAAKAMLSTTIRLAAAEQRDLTDIEKRSGVDFDQLQTQWGSALDDLVSGWSDISEAQRDELAAQIATAVDDNPDDLGGLHADSAAATLALLASMKTVAEQAAAEQVVAAGKQGVTLPDVEVTDDDVRPAAEAIAAAMAAGTASVAGRSAAQALGTGDGKHVADQTVSYLKGLTDSFLRDQLGGALSMAQHAGRMAVLSGWDGDVDLYASEVNDKSVCANCRAIDGAKFDSRDAADAAYGGGKYVACQGGARCRGQLIAVFGSDQAKASASLATTITLGGPMGTTTGGVVKASVSVEDISRRYYESAGYSMWITEMQVDPLQLIAADDSSGKYYRIPVEISGEEFTFGEAQEVAMSYQDVKTAAKAPVQWADRKAAFAAAGKNEDGTDRIAPDVSPAGQAIRKAKEKAAATVPAVLETEVEKTPDADPATGPNNTPEEASVDAAKMREALGLGPDASDEDLQTAFAAQLSSTIPPAAVPASPIDVDAIAALAASGQAVLVDKAQLATLVETARKGELAYNQNRKNERDAFLSGAVREGRIPPASLAAYEKLWDADPEGTRKTVSLLARNIIPVAASGFAGQEVDTNEADGIYTAMYGKDAR